MTRTSWALNVKSRTLRAEIDLHNTDAQILPGMYAYGEVIIERPNTRAVPVQAVTYSGGQSFCYLYEGGKSVRTEIQTGINNGEWIEVTNRRVRSLQDGSTEDPWLPFDGSEQVILADLSILADGGSVTVEKPDSKTP